MTSFLQHLCEHRRITILRILDGAPGYSANDSILTDGVNAMGVASTRDQVKADLSWLSDVGLVSLHPVENLHVAVITPRGTDVAKGLAVVEGVKRPAAIG